MTVSAILHCTYVSIESGKHRHHSQGWWKQSGCSGFGRTSFSQGKDEIQFLQKQVINKSASVIFILVRFIILSYNT